MRIFIVTTLERIVDTLIDRIIKFTDYFIIHQHITLSETLLFLMSVVRATWLGSFGTVMGEDRPIVNGEYWFPIFSFLSIIHFTSFFLGDLRYRIAAIILTAFVWCFLGALHIFTGVISPAVPNFFIFSLLSIFIAVRLVRDWRNG